MKPRTQQDLVCMSPLLYPDVPGGNRGYWLVWGHSIWEASKCTFLAVGRGLGTLNSGQITPPVGTLLGTETDPSEGTIKHHLHFL